jgi:hypothetical protein
MQLMTIGQIAQSLRIPTHRVKYAIDRYRIPETQRAGIIRLFDTHAVESVKRAVQRTTGRSLIHA